MSQLKDIPQCVQDITRGYIKSINAKLQHSISLPSMIVYMCILYVNVNIDYFITKCDFNDNIIVTISEIILNEDLQLQTLDRPFRVMFRNIVHYGLHIWKIKIFVKRSMSLTGITGLPLGQIGLYCRETNQSFMWFINTEFNNVNQMLSTNNYRVKSGDDIIMIYDSIQHTLQCKIPDSEQFIILFANLPTYKYQAMIKMDKYNLCEFHLQNYQMFFQ